MQTYLAQVAADLIRFASVDTPSHAHEVKKVMEYVEKRLRKLKGCFVQRLRKDGKLILIITFKPRHKKPLVFLHGHLDVVPAEKNQFLPQVKKGRLVGRGAQDMKGGCAVMIALIEHFAQAPKKPDVGVMFVLDEETSGKSAEMLFKTGYRPQLFVTLEPTDLTLVIETKGILGMEGRLLGHSVHGSMPWLTQNPIDLFCAGLAKLHSFFPPLRREAWKTTLSINELESGDSANRTPPDLSFKIDIRYVPQDSPQKIIHKVKTCFPRSTRWKIVKCDPPHQKPKNMSLIQQLKRVARRYGMSLSYARAPYATDARFFSAQIPSLVFGPKGGGMHGPQEWVDLKSLHTLFEILKKFLYNLKAF